MNDSEVDDALPAGLKLERTAQGLTLLSETEPDAGAVRVDFLTPEIGYRRHQPLGKEMLIKAVGGVVDNRRIAEVPSIIDATAGLGQDSFMLACAGWQVIMLERSPVIHALLSDGIARAILTAHQSNDATLIAILDRMRLQAAVDSVCFLRQTEPVDVVYLDPMFPERNKSARVKKNRYLLQHLHGAEAQGDGLLMAALDVARKVVVKRPRLAPALQDKAPSASIAGKTARFDIYVGKSRRCIIRS
ncbi:class I SAM-dependent methyltransferase [Pseudohongiella spirulinae]|uniref:class I SAM-dependent methyltransferase n=1 Tax=Pseudohongiella spirulinae TaxID=1249552 RepID=UPI0007175876|nr:class I SAM-dependent methyltransferase [Pseudohongiella spirulinae]